MIYWVPFSVESNIIFQLHYMDFLCPGVTKEHTSKTALQRGWGHRWPPPCTGVTSPGGCWQKWYLCVNSQFWEWSEQIILLFFLQLQSPRSSCSMAWCWREATGLPTCPTAAWASSLPMPATTSGLETVGGTAGRESTESLSFTTRNTQLIGIFCKTEGWAGTWYPQQCP